LGAIAFAGGERRLGGGAVAGRGGDGRGIGLMLTEMIIKFWNQEARRRSSCKESHEMKRKASEMNERHFEAAMRHESRMTLI
jgi:hypothetical protein